MNKGLWRNRGILHVIIVIICSASSMRIGSTSILFGPRKNQSAETNEYDLVENKKFSTIKIAFEDDYQPLKTHPRKLRSRRNVMQMARMLKCMSGCNPLSYRGYGCFCGYRGSGQPVDDIDRCCLQHDWCYSLISCPQTLIYFVPYTWQCMNPGAAHCVIATMPGISQKCATQLCECDREFAHCVSNYPCPRKKPGCKINNYIMYQAITNNDI